jgi:hypothetical protein
MWRNVLYFLLQLVVSFDVLDAKFIKFKGYQQMLIPSNLTCPRELVSIYAVYRGFPIVQIMNPLALAVQQQNSIVVLVDLNRTQYNILAVIFLICYSLGFWNLLALIFFTWMYLYIASPKLYFDMNSFLKTS